jgi:hypothetical protein
MVATKPLMVICLTNAKILYSAGTFPAERRKEKANSV